MPETTDTTTTETETVPVPEVETSTEPTDPTDEVAKWKALARQNEARAKANADAAKRLEEIENANKSELERERDRAAQAEAELTQMRIEAERNAVALAKGLTPTQAKRLMGATREELEADADELLADLKASRPSAAASADGQGRQGEPVGSAKQITSRDQLTSMSREERLAAYRDGRLNGLMRTS
jgi:hypothetical protein